jgi:hypothetical protein
MTNVRGLGYMSIHPPLTDDMKDRLQEIRQNLLRILRRLEKLGWRITYTGYRLHFSATLMHRELTVNGNGQIASLRHTNHPGREVVAMDWDWIEAKRAIETPGRKWRMRTRPKVVA